MALLIFMMLSHAQALPVLGTDDIPWSFNTNAKVVAVGDVHGDYEALRYILEQNGLINSEGKWIGGKAHLVLNGDLVSYGNHSKEVLDLAIRLEGEALAAGGRVHAILGNHEVTISMGNIRYMSEQDKNSFARMTTTDPSYTKSDVVLNFTGNSRYALWLRSLNSIVKINNTIFVHAGLGTWALDTDIGALNASIRLWLKYFQLYNSPESIAPKYSPDPTTKWVIMPGDSPMWTGVMNDDVNEMMENRAKQLPDETLVQILKKLAADVVVSGHITTRDHKISMSHSLYGSKVIQTDTGISSYYKGSLSALVFENRVARTWYGDRAKVPRYCGGQLH